MKLNFTANTQKTNAPAIKSVKHSCRMCRLCTRGRQRTLLTTKVHLAEAPLFFDQICVWNHGKRKTEVPAGLHSAFGGLCHRHWQRVEVPLYCRSGRRRRVRAVLPDLPHHSGPAHHDHGVCGGPRFPQKPGAGLSGTGNDVLHHRCRLDAALFLHDRRR